MSKSWDERTALDVGEEFLEWASRRTCESPGEIVMAVARPGGRVLLMTKGIYPEGVYRLPTGKMHIGETSDQAFDREILEETGFCPSWKRLIGVSTCVFRHGNDEVTFESNIYLTAETDQYPSPLDAEEDITAFKETPLDALADTARHLESLPHPWHDWGRWRAVAHRLVLASLAHN